MANLGGPIEPEPSQWAFADLRDARAAGNDAHALDDLVGMGADVAPGTLLAAYRHGIFPMPGESWRDPMMWFSPVERGVLPLDELRVSRSLRRSARDFEIRFDTRFEEVMASCADPRRPHGWIDKRIRKAYGELHGLGWAHSVEAWQDDRLVGGLYGVAIGGLFAGESMFHRVRDASKVALVGLVSALREAGSTDQRILDVQWRTDHLASLGVVEVARNDYLDRLEKALRLPLPEVFGGPSSEAD
ncbi:leucyl/phenylalanyl-tRNA--protein transferase [Nocardioides albertanoniae]|uniref:Leucyl/phenylalanyl-tRNA--protein transferase n=1 Tax=Nocardioides albertanoniae TaxID=1175486 RepID=A0A543A142_9ACTN|nr:leucyl/phenylalanyl-tRNA--protein transferase [Nocardioides albertanoniae]TQL66206.1 leucyl/phenylalanyl-tRNA--protein transferase [Nocardioides albertanoniae]